MAPISSREKLMRYDDMAADYLKLQSYLIMNFPHDVVEGELTSETILRLLSRLKAREAVEHVANEIFKDYK